MDASSGQATITFTLDEDGELSVSVVGSFNGWDPARNPLLPQEDGGRSASVTVDASQDVHFRYLGTGTRWFDDPEADSIAVSTHRDSAHGWTNW